MKDKVAIITGGSGGLGFAIAKNFTAHGAHVLLCNRKEESLAAAKDKLAGQTGRVETLCVDLCADDAAQEVVDAVKNTFGRLDIVVNCAANFIWKPFLDLSKEQWESTLAINLSAPFFMTQAAARFLVEQAQGGSIINISTIHGVVGDGGVVPHCASKFGLMGLTKASSEALRKHQIRVNAVSPGAMEPDSADAPAAGIDEKITQFDVAQTVHFLASDASQNISGTTIEAFGKTRPVIAPM